MYTKTRHDVWHHVCCCSVTGLLHLLEHAVMWHNSSSGSGSMLQKLGVQLVDAGEVSSSSSNVLQQLWG
jgi:hypothetical protein